MRLIHALVLSVGLWLGGTNAAWAAGDNDADDWVRFEEHGCYGSCPVFSTTVFADGRVRYRGYAYVNTFGERWRHVSPVRARRVIARSARFRPKPATLWATDMRETSTRVRRHGVQAGYHYNRGWQKTPRVRRAAALDRRLRRATGAGRLARGPVGCAGRAILARFRVPSGSRTYGGSATPVAERAFFARFVDRLKARPRTKLELWVATNDANREAAKVSLSAVIDAFAAEGIDQARIRWTRVDRRDNADEAGVVYVRGASGRCRAPRQ